MEHKGVFRFTYFGKELDFNSELVKPKPRFDHNKYMINSLEFDISGTCNLNCKYCVEKLTIPIRNYMSKKVWKKALNMLFDQIKEGTPISIHFGSGEPLLNKKTLQEISFKAEMLAKIHHCPLELNLTTNGTLLSKDICNWLIHNNWNIKISLDGDEKTHNKYRIDYQGKSTYKRIVKWIKYLVKNIPDKLIVNSVLCTNSNPRLIFNSLASLGIKNIQILPIIGFESSPFLLNDNDILSYHNFLKDYIKKVASGANLPLLIRLIGTMKRVLGYNNNSYVCGAGRNFFSVSSDGYYYPCFRFVGIEKYQIGDINNGINFNMQSNFLRKVGKLVNKREKCSVCWAAYLCCGPCFANVELLCNQNGEPPQWFCDYVLNECRAAIWLVDELKIKNPEKLLNLLNININSIF